MVYETLFILDGRPNEICRSRKFERNNVFRRR